MLKLFARLCTALLVLPVALAAADCGGSGSSGTGGGGTTGGVGGCTVSGRTCQTLCSASLGCVTCLTNKDCGAADPICVLGECRQCGASADCATGQACYPRNFTCQPACKSDSDCTAPDQTHCNVKTGACVGCLDNTQCAGNTPICDQTLGRCVGCQVNADCGAAAPVCDAQSGECVECLVDANCKAGYRCTQDHQCHAYCTSNANCDSAHPYCNVKTGECRTCLTNANCPASAPLCTNDGTCVGCLTNADCKNASLPFCFHQDHCAQCVQNSDCPNGGKCKGGVCG